MALSVRLRGKEFKYFAATIVISLAILLVSVNLPLAVLTAHNNILEKVGANSHPSVQIAVDHIDHPVSIVLHTYANMKLFLQANLQSLNTSRKLIDLVIQRHRPDVLLLQELWSSNDTVFIKDFAISAIKLKS